MSASTASAAGSWVSVAVATFGVLVVVMGVVFSFVMPSSPPRLAHVYADVGGHDVIVSDVSAIPIGRPHRQIDLSKPVLNKPGSAEMEMVAPDVLQARLQESGVWTRLALPSTTKATVAAMLPLLIVGLGLLALAVGVPALLIRGGMGRLAVQGLGVVGVVAAVVAGLQFGALSWPGRSAYDATPSMPWLPPPG